LSGGVLGRADLLRALAATDPAAEEDVLDLLGFERTPAATRPAPTARVGEREVPLEPPSIETGELRATPFWRAVAFAVRAQNAPLESRAWPAPTSITWDSRPEERPVLQLLAPWRDLLPKLRLLIATGAPVGEVDVDRVVAALCRGRQLDPLPRERQRRWPRDFHVIVDRSDRLMPFWDDQDVLVAALQTLMPGQRIMVARVDETLDDPCFAESGETHVPPEPGGVVLALGDLGCIDGDRSPVGHWWGALGRRIAAAGCRTAALLPVPLARCPNDLGRVWNAVPWEQAGPALPQDQASRRRRADRLLGLLSSSVRIEPGLLRAVRRALPPGEADAGTEADVWQHRDIASRHPVAATPHRDAIQRTSPIGQEDDALVREVLRHRHRWRQELPREIWFLEVIGLPAGVRDKLPYPQDFATACRFFEVLHGDPSRVIDDPQAIEAWLDEVRALATPEAWDVTAFREAVGPVAMRDRSFVPPDSVDPASIKEPPTGLPTPQLMLELRQLGRNLTLSSRDDPVPGPGSLLGALRSGNGLLSVNASDDGKPAWADDWGEDAHGTWATFSVVGKAGARVTQRLRWCPPGRFQMGSPETEEGRWDDEGPRHEVAIADGFWMFDTACTEALWGAVTGNAPDRRRGAAFPVTNVSWEDARSFLRQLNAAKPGLDLSLPSEAQWEYACRAGTDTPYNFGTRISRDLVRYESRAPVPVGSLPPNGWGLFEMHGNVAEWCADHWHSSYDGAPADGSAWSDAGGAAGRVVRGGSWDGIARCVRAAYRNHFDPADRGDFLGFRCARVQQANQAGGAAQVAAPADPARRPGAERGRPQGPTSDATLLRVGVSAPAPLPRAGGLLIRTDREELRLGRLTKPVWASEIGRDGFGLFADVALPNADVIQRMRWIPPGRFLMGSPDGEEGRDEDEGPQHEVTLAEGFWLFDTPCTQALWQAVMGDNPSQFKGPTRPVEQVSFEDVRGFLDKLNGLVPDLGLTLPSEAQWEYACRAGTETATYAGDMRIVGENNAPVLDAIAWYGGNSGVGFDLDNGHDTSDWKEKQYDHTRAGTRSVAQKAANPWGLYDMLGNVWEWCGDHGHSSYQGAPTDGSAWVDPNGGAASRVVRGGSWCPVARHVRAAYRNHFDPAFRNDNLGFRCARVQSDSVVSETERRAGRSKRRERSDPAATTSPKRGPSDRPRGKRKRT